MCVVYTIFPFVNRFSRCKHLIIYNVFADIDTIVSSVKRMNNTSNENATQTTPETTTHAVHMGLSSFVMWCLAFGVVDIIVIIANVVTLLVFYSSKCLLRKRHNHFLILLAISDVMVGLVVMPLYIYQLVSWWINEHSVLKNAVFDTFTAMDILSGFASVFTLAVIAADRVYAIVFPFYHRNPPKGVYPCMIASVWVLSGLLVVYYFLSRVNILPKEAFIYLLLMSISLSLLVICISYLLVWARVRCFAISHGMRGASFRERRLAELLFLITVIFLFTWLPFHVINFIFHFCKSQKCLPSSKLVYFSKLLHYSNSFLNPVVYSYRNVEFRRCLKRLLKNITSQSKPLLTDKRECNPRGIRLRERRLLLERQEAFRRILVKESRV